MNYKNIIAEATRINRLRNREDHRAGFAAPNDCGPFLHLRTAIAAIEAGIQTEDWNCVAEGQAMLLEIGRAWKEKK